MESWSISIDSAGVEREVSVPGRQWALGEKTSPSLPSVPWCWVRPYVSSPSVGRREMRNDVVGTDQGWNDATARQIPVAALATIGRPAARQVGKAGCSAVT